MRHALLALTIPLLAPIAIAQNCFDGNFGTRLGINTVDTVYPMQSIGFVFPFAGNTYTDIHVNDHGFVQLSNAGVPAPLLTNDPILYTPTVANFAAGGPKIAPLYSDMELTGGGEVFIRTSPTQCVVTWWNVQSFGIPSTRFSFQLTLEPNGIIRFTYGPGVTNNSTWGGVSDNGVCGVTPAGGVPMPASLDLSLGGASTDNSTFENWATANTFDLANNTMFLAPASPGFAYTALGAGVNCASASNYGAGCDGMSLTSVGLPSIGNAAFTLRTSGVPLVSPISFTGFGSTVINPGIDLTSIGMAGCFAYQGLDLGLFTSGPVSGQQCDFVIGIPASPSLVGAAVAAQAVALSLTTTLNLASSNGTQVNIGNGN